MMSKRLVAGAVLAGVVLLAGATAEAKGPQGIGGNSHSFGPVGPQPGSPPGWSSQGERKGWDGSTVPPGWDNGLRKGWDGGSVPPGFDDGLKKGWDTTVTPGEKK